MFWIVRQKRSRETERCGGGERKNRKRERKEIKIERVIEEMEGGKIRGVVKIKEKRKRRRALWET